MCRGHQENHPPHTVRRRRSDQGYGQRCGMTAVMEVRCDASNVEVVVTMLSS